MEKYQFAFHSEIIGYTSPVHGSIKGTKDYLLETWRYHTNRHSKGFSSTRIRPCTTSRAFSFV